MKFSPTQILSLITLAACPLVSMAGDETPAGGFHKKLSLQGITFQVKCPNKGAINKLTITPGGLEGENKPITVEIEGSVSGAEVGDLDANGFPEVYVYVQGAGSGSYGSLIAFAANKKKSLSQIHLPDLSSDKKNSKGYMGHDEFRVVESSLVRRFPLYNVGDSNAGPTGKTRQLQYKLVAGEAGWKLRLDRVAEF